jgi:hypothetical protein
MKWDGLLVVVAATAAVSRRESKALTGEAMDSWTPKASSKGSPAPMEPMKGDVTAKVSTMDAKASKASSKGWSGRDWMDWMDWMDGMDGMHGMDGVEWDGLLVVVAATAEVSMKDSKTATE